MLDQLNAVDILLVEDNPRYAEVTIRALKEPGCARPTLLPKLPGSHEP